MKRFAAAVCVLALASCGGGSANPSAPSALTLPIVLSGQSNALPERLGSPLQAIYPRTLINAEGSMPIRAWAPGQPLWTDLAAQLHQPIAAVVRWQGESDLGSLTFVEDERDLFTRIRRENGNTALLIVVVKIVQYPGNERVREAQEAYVRTDPFAVLVAIDDLQTDGGNHLAAAGYPIVADRVLAVIRSRA